MSVRFARRNPQRLGANARWRPGRPDLWLKFGPRTSLLSGKPSRATTPGNSLLNYLYAILQSEMTIALLARGLDPGIGMFHADIDGRASLSLDAIEAIRPYIEYWLFTYLQSTVFANRDFNELPDGEVRLSHPLTSHLAHTAALWRKACEPIAVWLARCFDRLSGAASIRATLAPAAVTHLSVEPEPKPLIPRLMPPLSAFIAVTGGRRLSAPAVLRQRAGVRDDPVPLACWECGRALAAGRRAFCSDACQRDYRRAMAKPLHTAAEAVSHVTRNSQKVPDGVQPGLAGLPKSHRQALRQWYAEELQPRLSRMNPAEIERRAGVRRSYAYYIVAGTRVPHPRHYPDLAALAGVELPKTYAAASS